VDEALPAITPAPELAADFDGALAAHEEVKAVAARWLLNDIDSGEVGAALAPAQARLEQRLLAGDRAIAAAYGVDAAELAEYRHRAEAAMAGLFD
jgi:hypothetical protein